MASVGLFIQILTGGFILSYAFQRKFLFTTILLCAAAGILIGPASADVTSWELSHKSPSVGDVITISGKAPTNEIIEVSISYEEIVPVSGKSFRYQIDKLIIPKTISGGENSFKVNATGEEDIVVKDMNVRVKKYKWISRHVYAEDGIATISQSHVPSWISYFVKIDGDIVSKKEDSDKDKCKSSSNDGKVKLTFNTSYDAAKADSDGNFICSYDTDSLPAGNYTITIGKISHEFTLSPAKEKDPEENKKIKCL